jgi:uncharacterized protein YcfJ
MHLRILLSLFFVAVTISASAADPTAATAKATVTAPVNKIKRYPFHANVASVDAVKQTITLDGKKKQRVLHVTPTTRIQKDKKAVALASINVGEYITGSLRDTEGLLEATTVNVGGLAPKTDKPAQASSGVRNTFTIRGQTPATKVAKPAPSTKP